MLILGLVALFCFGVGIVLLSILIVAAFYSLIFSVQTTKYKLLRI